MDSNTQQVNIFQCGYLGISTRKIYFSGNHFFGEPFFDESKFSRNSHRFFRYKINPLPSCILDQVAFYPVFLIIMVTLNEFLSAHVTRESNKMNVLGRLETITEIIPISICYWIPIQFINFRFVPLHFRLIYVQFAAYVFNIYLSMKINS